MASSVRELRLDAVYPFLLLWKDEEGYPVREYHRTRDSAEESLLGFEPYEKAEIVATREYLFPEEVDCPF